MNDQLLNYYNYYFAGLQEFTLLEPFTAEDDKNCFAGKIKANGSNVELIINTAIPYSFPFESIVFSTDSIKGYPHLYQNVPGDYKFCLNTPFIDDIAEKLQLEMTRLADWIKIYLNGGKIDNHYDYLIFPRTESFELFFSETSEDFTADRFADKSFGEFDLYKFKLDHLKSTSVFFSDNLGNHLNPWNTSILSAANKEKHKGYWVYIENEPVDQDKSVYSTWSDLCHSSFSAEFVSYIKERMRFEFATHKKEYTYKSIGKKSNFSVKKFDFKLPVAIGYKIPSEKSGFEIHWELVLLYYHEAKHLEKIGWAFSKNISEQRFFGRGGFCKYFRELSIIILGVGAIGSSVAEILVRGGIKKLALADGDMVDSGNICRSSYSLTDYSANKAKQLGEILEKISPHVKITYTPLNFKGQPQFSNEYENQKDLINEFDLVIDCTASNEVLYFLSHLDTKSRIITLGITNKANQLLCLSREEGDSLFDKRRVVLYSFGEIVPPSFFEGTGCFYPTFEASFFDINSLLNMTLRHINHQLLNKTKITSFHVAYEKDRIEICDYKLLHQKDLNFTLTIYQSCIDIIYSFSRMNFPYEFGGVLVGGYSDNGKHIYITDVLLPDSFTNSYISFKGDMKRINKQLLNLHDETDGNIIYLGDWHSHPNMSNHYSSVDFNSIEQQARSTSVAINNPILAINSIGKKDYEIGYYIYYKKKLYKFTE